MCFEFIFDLTLFSFVKYDAENELASFSFEKKSKASLASLL